MDTPQRKILVTYSSGYGATKEVAEEVANVLKNYPEFKVVTQGIHECEHVDEFDAIILGSSIRADKPLANARDFFSTHRFTLAEKKIALFVVSITAATPTGVEIAEKTYVTQLHDRYPWLSPISVAAFGGKIDFDKLNPVMQNLVRNVMKEKGVNGNGSFDARNWDDIRAWADSVASKIKEPSLVA